MRSEHDCGARDEDAGLTVPSFQFLLLALGGAVAFNLSGNPWWRAAILLLLNLFLIQTFSPNLMSLAPYAAFLALGYVGVLARGREMRWSAWLFPAAVVLSFVWLKRYLFVPHALLLPTPYVAIGLSYVFFRVLHLVIDGWEEMPAGPRGLVSYVNYTLNFTSLVSGPIQRYEDYRSQEVAPEPLDIAVVGRALERIISGFFKVYIVSTLLQAFQHREFATLLAEARTGYRIVDLSILIGLYPIFLFFNFSGYTDFAIGCARLFRIRLPENFDRPFSSLNFIDFWSRWHITLSQWLKTYVYSPLLLAMMRRATSAAITPLLGVAAYFVTFFLVGAWHGQTSEFLFFGILQGGGVAANKLYQEAMTRFMGREGYARLSDNRLYRILTRGLTFTWFAFTLLWFWSTWRQMRQVLTMVGPSDIGMALVLLLAVATLALTVLAGVTAAAARRGGPVDGILYSRYTRTVFATALAVIILVANFVVSAPAPQLVYKDF